MLFVYRKVVVKRREPALYYRLERKAFGLCFGYLILLIVGKYLIEILYAKKAE